MVRQQIILIQPDAPAKPAVGAPCNGCGLCCLAEPCPLGMVLSGRRVGACKALRWEARQGMYRCGVMMASAENWSPRLRWIPRWLRGWLGRSARALAVRWIAAAKGCDSTLEPSPTMGPSTTPSKPGNSATP